MVKITDIIPSDLLESELANGYIRFQVDHGGPTAFKIWNYTEKAQFEKHWNAATINCRGLITRPDETIAARPWKKFFNYGEGRLYIDDHMPVEVTDKMDGSLGILYQADGGHVGDYASIATRGSFNSDQALHASRLFNARYVGDINYSAICEYTFLFEIIYPANRIVVNYGEFDDLVLLGAVHIERGYYLGPYEAAGILNWTGPITKVFEYKNMMEAFAAPMRENAEGLVVRSGTEMVKIKQVDYVELHRVVTNLNPRTVWLQLGQGETISSICEKVPDEFHQFVTDVGTQLKEEFSKIEAEALADYSEIVYDLGPNFERKDFAAMAEKSKYRAYMFMLLDGKMIDGAIWQSLRPSLDKV